MSNSEVKNMNTILFDLDGTLLPIDMEAFENVYFKGLAKKFHDITTHDKLAFMVMESLKEMVNNTDLITNEKVFMKKLATFLDEHEIQEYEKRFSDFYVHEFDELKQVTTPNKHIQQAVMTLKDKGYDLIVATNPMFPKLAIEKRIQWAGFNVSDFKYVTSFEKNHYCKPQLAYYKEVLDQNNIKPNQCMMVGNDTVEDMIASKLGITTFLIDNHIIEREQAITPDYSGDYQAFYAFAKQLPIIEKGEK